MESGEKLSAVLFGAVVAVAVSACLLTATTDATFIESLWAFAWSSVWLMLAAFFIWLRPEYWLPVASVAVGLVWLAWWHLMDVYFLVRIPGGGLNFFLGRPPAWLVYFKWGGVVVPFCIGIASGVRAYSRRW